MTGASFNYDGAGNRLQATKNGTTTRYIYDANGNLLAEADTNNVVTRYYVYGAGLLAFVTPQGQTYNYNYNAVGSTVAITDQSQTIVNEYTYDPFGAVAGQQETIAQPFKYVGQFGVMAEPNGFNFMRARYYDPNVGRFVSEDPSGFGGGDVNLMAYVLNNPVNYTDPEGLDSKSFTENLASNIRMTNNVIFGDHIKTAIGSITSGSVARTIGTVTPLQLLFNVIKTGEFSISNMTALGTLGSAAVNMAVNGALVSGALETGIVIGSGINAAIQTYDQTNTCGR